MAKTILVKMWCEGDREITTLCVPLSIMKEFAKFVKSRVPDDEDLEDCDLDLWGWFTDRISSGKPTKKHPISHVVNFSSSKYDRSIEINFDDHYSIEEAIMEFQ